MTFSSALTGIKEGKSMTRVKWLGESKYLTLADDDDRIDINEGHNTSSVWNPSQEDLLAEYYSEYQL